MRRLSIAALLGALVAVPGMVLHAQQVSCVTAAAANDPPLARLSQLWITECLGGSRDLDALTKNAMKVLPARLSDTASKKEIELVVLSALDPVLKATARERDKSTEGSAQRVLLTGLDSLVTLVRIAVTTGVTLVATETGATAGDRVLLRPITWTWDPTQERIGELPLRLAGSVQDACTTTTTAQCTSAVVTAEFVLRAATLVKRSLDYYSRPFLAAALVQTNMRDARWTAYFDETLVQFPWELALNSARFTQAARKTRGFAMPPSSQWVLLHPMAGVEYVWSAPQGSRMTPAVAMEILGYNRWSWNAMNKPAGALGASVVAAFSDRAGAPNVGYGVLVRYAHKYSVSVTSRGGKTGVLLSSEFGTWLSGKQDEAQNAMRLKRP